MAALVLNSSCRATPFPIPSTIRFRLPPSTFLPRKSSFPGSDVVGGRRTSLRIVRVSSDDGKNKTSSSSTSSSSSYLDMWKNAVERGRKDIEFQRIVPESEVGGDGDLEKKSVEFQKILEVSKEERDRIQRMQVIDRAAAAIAAAKSLLKETTTISSSSSSPVDQEVGELDGLATGNDGGGTQSGITFVSQPTSSLNVTPGPDFWSWTPPHKISSDSADTSVPQAARKLSPSSAMPNPVIEKDRHVEYLSIPFQSKSSDKNLETRLPPLQSLMEVQKEEENISSVESPSLQEEHELGVQFSTNAAEAVTALNNQDNESYGVNPDGLRWWRETGIQQRPDGVVCKWTLTRGVSADEVTEWEEKYWEAADEFDYKELGSQKSGRDAWGNVWREYWKETMWQDAGLGHLEKTADKWGKNGQGDEWQEKWWEHYDASGYADKWAHKWCSIDPFTQLDAGHAHVWHERWGEKYDGHGGSIKYTDKWAERCEGDGWSKWGDKWDENFDMNGHGVKQGETWWEGKYGETWNRTWGEGHNGSGWVHKYGKSSSGEHWDTHAQQDTWYERYPHFGFMHCFDNSVQLREVRKPSESDTP
ncbi:unnamed protein product [Rhodiola kirilowii]